MGVEKEETGCSEEQRVQIRHQEAREILDVANVAR